MTLNEFCECGIFLLIIQNFKSKHLFFLHVIIGSSPMRHTNNCVGCFFFNHLSFIGQISVLGKMETELKQDQEATTELYLNGSTPNITTTGIVSHKDVL